MFGGLRYTDCIIRHSIKGQQAVSHSWTGSARLRSVCRALQAWQQGVRFQSLSGQIVGAKLQHQRVPMIRKFNR